MAQIRGANPGSTIQFFVFGIKNDKFLFYSDMTNLLIENRTGKTEETVVIFKCTVSTHLLPPGLLFRTLDYDVTIH